MNLTVKLLRTIGSPFALGQELPRNYDEALELYTCATKNKIGLLYLGALKDQEKLESSLKSKYREDCRKRDEQMITLNRISKLFNSSNINYVIFKSIMPFLAVPNDVDILHMGSDDEYKKAAEIMLQSGYIEVEAPADSSQRMFHDTRVCEHVDPHKKDVYDVDLYQKVVASYIVYLDKRKFKRHVIEINMSRNKIKVLRPEAELVALIVHSIIPEQICTLFAYYATLYHLAKMNREEINGFINLAKENNVTFPVRAHFSLVAELHQVAYGFVPEKVEEVLASLGDETNERKNLLRNDFKMPHKYCWLAIIRTLLEKAKEEKFRRSVTQQIVSMLKPKLAKWVISNVIWRRKRETY